MPDSPGIFTSHNINAKGLTRVGYKDRLISMGLKHVAQQATDRFFVIDDQNALECKERLMGRSVKEQRHNL
jgi:hypothetical protein